MLPPYTRLAAQNSGLREPVAGGTRSGLPSDQFSNYDGLEVYYPPNASLRPGEDIGGEDHFLAVYGDGKGKYIDVTDPSGLQPLDHSFLKRQRQRWRRKSAIASFALLFILFALAIIIAMTKKYGEQDLNAAQNQPFVSSPTPPTVSTTSIVLPTPSVDPAIVMHHTGLATIEPYYSVNESLIWLFYQQAGGDIRYEKRLKGGNWSPGANLAVNDCLNGSSLAAVFYYGGVGSTFAYPNVFQVFYINNAGFLTSTSAVANESFASVAGGGSINLNISSLPTIRAPGTALSIILDDYPDSLNNTIYPALRLFMATSNGSIQEYSWQFSSSPSGEWVPGFIFPNSNGLAGVSAVRNFTVITVSFVTLNSELEVWWKDYNVEGISSTQHPLRQWTKVTYGGPYATMPNSSVSALNSIYFQSNDEYIYGSSLVKGSSGSNSSSFETLVNRFKVTSIALPGTSLACFPSTGATFGTNQGDLLYLQTNYGALMEYSRDNIASSWNITTVPTIRG